MLLFPAALFFLFAALFGCPPRAGATQLAVLSILPWLAFGRVHRSWPCAT